MDPLMLIFWGICLVLLLFSIKKGREKTKDAFKKARGMMKNMIGDIIGIILLIGLIVTFVPPETIEGLMAGSNDFISTTIASLLGSITLIPAFVAFPLIGSFLEIGISLMTAVAFLTTLTMVGVVTFPLEKQEFGWKFAVVRNGLSFVFAILIALGMGVIL